MECAEERPEVCIQCATGPLKADGTCYKQSELPHLCSQFDPSSGKCLQCQSYLEYYDEYRYRVLAGIYQSSTGLCLLCPDGCSACTSPTECTECISQFYILQGTQCVRCPDNCPHCYVTKDICNGCLARHYLNADSTQCLPCAEGCYACDGPTIDDCLNCDLDRGYNGMNGKRCKIMKDSCRELEDFPGQYDYQSYCKHCNPEYYLQVYSDPTDTDCIPCAAGCVGCITAEVCTTCADGYYLAGTGCYRCPSTCTLCSSASRCLACDRGYQLYRGKCYLDSDAVTLVDSDPGPTFFFSERLQKKLVYLLILMQILMALFRLSLLVFQKISSVLYQRRISYKKSLKIQLAREYTLFSRSLRKSNRRFKPGSPQGSPGLTNAKTRGSPSPPPAHNQNKRSKSKGVELQRRQLVTK